MVIFMWNKIFPLHRTWENDIINNHWHCWCWSLRNTESVSLESIFFGIHTEKSNIDKIRFFYQLSIVIATDESNFRERMASKILDLLHCRHTHTHGQKKWSTENDLINRFMTIYPIKFNSNKIKTESCSNYVLINQKKYIRRR